MLMNNVQQTALKMIQPVLKSVDPYLLVKKQLQVLNNNLHFFSKNLDLNSYKNIYILGAGKAVAPMALALEEMIEPRPVKGAIIVKYGHTCELKNVKIYEAGHPVPDENTLSATSEILKIARAANEDDLILFLISGGGSALFEQLPETINLTHLIALNKQLLSCGASIEEINVLRKHLSLVKGGRFSDIAAPAKMISFILSDVIGDPLASIASGPTVEDKSTMSDVWDILIKYKLSAVLPAEILQHYKKSLEAENHEAGPKPVLVRSKIENYIIGNNSLALNELVKQAGQLGYHAQILSDRIQGEAREIAKFWAAIIEYAILHKDPEEKICIVAGGEPTVILRGAGKGGRNQELVLAVLQQLKHIRESFYFCSIGTDGTDGPTDVAGAWIDQSSYNLASEKQLDLTEFLDDNNSYAFFQQLNQLITTGPTGTNVMDIMFCLL